MAYTYRVVAERLYSNAQTRFLAKGELIETDQELKGSAVELVSAPKPKGKAKAEPAGDQGREPDPGPGELA